MVVERPVGAVHGCPLRRHHPEVCAVVEEEDRLVGSADGEGREAEVGGGVHAELDVAGAV